MPDVDWEEVERFASSLHGDDPLRDWDTARRMARNAVWIAKDLEGCDPDRARLLCWFHAVREQAGRPAERTRWIRALRGAGMDLETQTWLWIALERFMSAPATPEECAAHDARALLKVGAIGAVRASLIAGKEGTGIAGMVSLLKAAMADAVFLTPAGRRNGVRRAVFARRFLRELDEE